MSSHPSFSEEPPRPLNEHEQRIFDQVVAQVSGVDRTYPRRAEEQVLDQMLAEAPHFDLRNLSPGSQLLLRSEDERLLQLTFIPWREEQEFDKTRPLLARIDANIGEFVRSVVLSDLIVVDGASIGEHMRPEDKLTVAQSCNLRYFNVLRRLYRKIDDPRPQSEIDTLVNNGTITFAPANGMPIERVVVPEVLFTPAIVAGQYGQEGTSIF